MATIPEDPTWAQIQAGLVDAGRAKRLAWNQLTAARAVIDAETIKAKLADQNVNRADADLDQWLNAVRRKIDVAT